MKNDLIYYDLQTKKLEGNIERKAKRFVLNDCVKSIDRDKWLVMPIKGYNKSSYTVTYYVRWSCNCQFYVKTGKHCSHILSVILKNTKRYD